MRLTKNFSLSEFDCKDGSEMPSQLLPNVLELAESLQELRNVLNSPIRINSAYRSLEHNSSIGGTNSSQHLFAKAADIVVKGKTPAQVATMIKLLILQGKMKQGGIGVYDTFTHYDIRGYKARW
jgi:uncharacterized protein YcbK (DUF882 family)